MKSILPYLSEKQQQVISMRLAGMRQQEIADAMNCTRCNVSILERSAWHNLKRAYATIEKWGQLERSVESMKKIEASHEKHELAEVMT